ncbi:MAG: hypothetical protein ACI89E_000115 [Planctomycetota bacterium]|jgi:hypothetical protein
MGGGFFFNVELRSVDALGIHLLEMQRECWMARSGCAVALGSPGWGRPLVILGGRRAGMLFAIISGDLAGASGVTIKLDPP